MSESLTAAMHTNHSVTRAQGWTTKRDGGGWSIDRNVDGKYDCRCENILNFTECSRRIVIHHFFVFKTGSVLLPCFACSANRPGYIFADFPAKPLYSGADCHSRHHMGSSVCEWKCLSLTDVEHACSKHH